MPYGAGEKNKDFVQSYCQSSTRYLNMCDLHDFPAAVIKMCFMALRRCGVLEQKYNSKCMTCPTK